MKKSAASALPAGKPRANNPLVAELCDLAQKLVARASGAEVDTEEKRLRALIDAHLDQGRDEVLKSTMAKLLKGQRTAHRLFREAVDERSHSFTIPREDGKEAVPAQLLVVPILLTSESGIGDPANPHWQTRLDEMTCALAEEGLLEEGQTATLLNYLYHPDELGGLSWSQIRKTGRAVAQVVQGAVPGAALPELHQTGGKPSLLAEIGTRGSSAGIRFLLGVIAGGSDNKSQFTVPDDAEGEESHPVTRWGLAASRIANAGASPKAEGRVIIRSIGPFMDIFGEWLLRFQMSAIGAQVDILLGEGDYDPDDFSAVVAVYGRHDDSRRLLGVSLIADNVEELVGVAACEIFEHQDVAGMCHLGASVAEDSGIDSPLLVKKPVPLENCPHCQGFLFLGPNEDGDLGLVHLPDPEDDEDEQGFEALPAEMGASIYDALYCAAEAKGTLEFAPHPVDSYKAGDDTEVAALLELAIEVAVFDDAEGQAAQRRLEKHLARVLKSGRDYLLDAARRGPVNVGDESTLEALDSALEYLVEEQDVQLGARGKTISSVLYAIPIVLTDVRNLDSELPAGDYLEKMVEGMRGWEEIGPDQKLHVYPYLYSPAELAQLKWSKASRLHPQLVRWALGMPHDEDALGQTGAPPLSKEQAAKPVPGLRMLLGVILPAENTADVPAKTQKQKIAGFRKWRGASEKTLLKALGRPQVKDAIHVVFPTTYFDAIRRGVDDLKEVSIMQQWNAVLKETGITADKVFAVVAAYEDTDSEGPLQVVASLTSLLDKELLGTVHCEVGGYDDADDTRERMAHRLDFAGVGQLQVLYEIIPQQHCGGCGAPVYLGPAPEGDDLAFGHTDGPDKPSQIAPIIRPTRH